MPFENQEQHRDVPQNLPQRGLQSRAAEYQTGSNIGALQPNANESLIARGMLTNLQIQTNTDAQQQTSTVSGCGAESYGTTKIAKDYYATGIVLNPEQDSRNVEQKFADFVNAGAHRMMDVHSYQNYLNGEKEKFEGIGEGLNNAKEKTKAATAGAWTAVTDGTVANFLAKPNAINGPLFSAIGNAIEAAKEDPNATNKLIEKAGAAIGEASRHYSSLSQKEQGKVIGETMFGSFNPEGSTEAAEAALKVADKVATHVDAGVMNVIQQSMQALEKMQDTSPEFLQQSKEMLAEYVRAHHVTGPQLEYAGVPKNYFDNVAQPAPKGDSFCAMSKAEGEGVSKGHGEAIEKSPKGELKGQTELVEGVNYRVEPKSGRLQRIDLGKLREPYDWPVYNERFDPNCIRQSIEGTCMSTCGEMVTNGRLTEAELIPQLGIPGNIKNLPTFLGPEWISKSGPISLEKLDKGGPWVAQMYDGEFRPTTKFGHGNLDTKQPHIVVVDGVTPDFKRMKIRDPLEGTSYEMTRSDFLKAWSRQAAFRYAE
jgi:hypothetical protein